MARNDATKTAIIDVRQIDYAASFSEVQILAAETGHQVAGMSLAIVVAGPLHTGIARQFATFAGKSGIRVGVFADPDAAKKWLRTDESAPA